VRDAFSPVPVLCAPYFPEEVLGPDGLDELGAALFGGLDAAAVLHEKLTQELVVSERGATLRLDLPFAQRGDIALRKIGQELVVRVDGQKRTLMLPPALAGHEPAGARFADGALHVTFDA
jgi:arsenite/tail-anchored protein-transporting ATPase